MISFQKPGLRWPVVNTAEEGVQESWDWEQLRKGTETNMGSGGGEDKVS